MHSQILDGTRGAGMQRQTKCGGRRKGVVSGGVLATLVLATTCAAMAQGRPAGGTSEADQAPQPAPAGPPGSFPTPPQPVPNRVTPFARTSGGAVSGDPRPLARPVNRKGSGRAREGQT